MPVALASADELVREIERTYAALARAAIVGISGVDCAGKSTLAEWLRGALADRGVRATVVSGDSFLRPRHVRRANPDQARGYYAESFDYSALAERVRTGAPGSVVLVEGVFLFTDELMPLFDLSIWIDIAPEDALARARSRPDDLHRYGDAEGVEREYRRRFLAGQALHLALDRPHERADAVLAADRVSLTAAR